MTDKEILEQLEGIKEGIKEYSKEYINDNPCNVWRRDVEALDIAISVLKYLNDYYKVKEGD